jgi:hypothetical protein
MSQIHNLKYGFCTLLLSFQYILLLAKIHALYNFFNFEATFKQNQFNNIRIIFTCDGILENIMSKLIFFKQSFAIEIYGVI